MIKPILSVFKDLDVTKQNETGPQWQWKMTVQFTLLAILKVLNLDNLPEHHGIYSSLCKAFLIHPDPEKEICEELEFLRLHYPEHL